jgi:prepilin-type N-terminal cleavage/methylation domain-containing protein
MKKIFNFQFLIINLSAGKQKGYTLVEMLAVIVVFSIIGGIISAIFASSLRGSNKANITNEVRQNGNYALIQMSRMITYAKSFNGISVDDNPDSYIADCYTDVTTSTTTPMEYHYLKILSFDGGEVVFSCDGGDGGKIASNDANLVNTNTIKVDSCKFFCSQASIAQPPTIGISFALSQRKESNFFENKASILFETTAVMRNSGN